MQVHTDIIAALKAAGANSHILDNNGHSADDFDNEHEEKKGLAEKRGGGVGGSGRGAGRLEPPRSRPGAPPPGGRDEL